MELRKVSDISSQIYLKKKSQLFRLCLIQNTVNQTQPNILSVLLFLNRKKNNIRLSQNNAP